MADKAKLPVIILFIFLLISVAGMVLGFIALQKEKEVNAGLNRRIEELDALRQSSEQRISNLEVENSALQKNLDEVNDRMLQINKELEEAQKVKEAASVELAQMKQGLESAVKEKTDIETKLKAKESIITDLQKELDTIRQDRDSVKQKVKDLESKQSVQLEKIVVPAQGQTSPAEAGAAEEQPQKKNQEIQEGKVLVVNKEYEFIVINLGNKDNMVIGDKIDLVRRDKVVGQFKIEEVRDTMSVASPITAGLIKQVKENEKVVFRR